MKTLFLFTLLTLIVIKTTKAQDTTAYVELASIDPNSNDNDLKQLDSYFKNVTVVGMGESTHGTHEFFIMRHRIFKYLVEHHQFNTFFLEADYASCLRANNYIHGKEDSINNVVNEIGLWPWMTSEMGDLINWMREYNAKNPKNQLNFIGVDMQKYVETVKQMDDILVRYKLPVTDSVIYNKMLDTTFFLVTAKEDLERYKTVLEEKKPIDITQFNKQDKWDYSVLLRHLNQIVESRYVSKKDYSFRDIKMAENILFHLKSDTTIKGFFWAHNGHISNFSYKKFNTKKWRGHAGGYLNNILNDKYFALGQDFDEGSFNAYFPDSTSTNVIEGNAYTLGSVSVGLSYEGSFSSIHRNLKDISFIEFSNFPKKYLIRKKRILMNSIGAAYIKRKTKPGKTPWERYLCLEINDFDAVILIKKSTPTHLLK